MILDRMILSFTFTIQVTETVSTLKIDQSPVNHIKYIFPALTFYHSREMQCVMQIGTKVYVFLLYGTKGKENHY